MARFFTVYYDSSVISKDMICREKKITKIFDKESWLLVISHIKEELNCNFIKYIRDLEKDIPMIRNKEYHEIEEENYIRMKYAND
jgi:hypothetical protein